MKAEEKLHNLLTKQLSASYVKVVDESELHAGHAGALKTGESHFAVIVVSNQFQGKSLVERHRLVYQVLKQPLKNKIHALRIQTYTNDEWSRRPGR